MSRIYRAVLGNLRRRREKAEGAVRTGDGPEQEAAAAGARLLLAQAPHRKGMQQSTVRAAGCGRPAGHPEQEHELRAGRSE